MQQDDPRVTIWKEWKTLPSPPAAAKLPMQSSAEIDETAQRIKKNGLREALVFFVDNKEEANGAKGPFPISLLDGRNRREALIRLGVDSPKEVWASPIDRRHSDDSIRILYAIEQTETFALGKGAVSVSTGWIISTDPEEYVLDVNVHRRHLTPEQKREAIASFIKADPKASDLAIAKKLKVSDHTVADVRKETVQNSRDANIEHLPIERAKAAVRANPSASTREIAKIADVVPATVLRAQKLIAAEESPATESEPTPPPATKNPSVEDRINKFIAEMWETYGGKTITRTLLVDFIMSVRAEAPRITCHEDVDALYDALNAFGPEEENEQDR